MVLAGGIHALFLLAFELCERGDEAVIAAPCFPPIRNLLEAVGADTQGEFLDVSNGGMKSSFWQQG